jgi:hypothetical protein
MKIDIEKLSQKYMALLNEVTNNTLIPKHQNDIREELVLFAKNYKHFTNVEAELDAAVNRINAQTNYTFIPKHLMDVRNSLSLFGSVANAYDIV